jgi:hypothetical protein
MSLFSGLKAKFRSDKQSASQNHTNVATSSESSPTNPGLSTITGFKDKLHLRRKQPELLNQSSMVVSTQSPLLTQDSQDTPSGTNVRPGFFAGASHVDASHGIFTDVAGDLNITEMNINVEAQVCEKPLGQ